MAELYGDQFYHALRAGSDRSAAAIVPLVIDLVKPASVVDVGCGTGAWLARFQRHGIQDILGLEFSEVREDLLHLDRSRIRIVDASRPFCVEREFDLAVSVEVAEHLPEESAAGFVESLVKLAPVALFSAAAPGQGGTNHLNEQWPSYWAGHFARHGYALIDCLRDRIWRDQRIDWWYRQNLLLFVRQDRAAQFAAAPPKGMAAALDRVMPYALRFAADPLPVPAESPVRVATTALMLSKNGAVRIAQCLQSIVDSNFADEIVVCIDSDTTDHTEEIARRFTPHVHRIQTDGTIETTLARMTALCSGDYILRLDDDETLGGNWDRRELEAFVRFNDLNSMVLPRRWIVPPGDLFIASEPWFPDFQVRFFRNDPSLIQWPTILHDPMVVRGRSMVLFDRWIDHYDLVIKSRPEREAKCEFYRRTRPKKHLSHFYLYEEQQLELLPLDDAGFAAAAQNFIRRRERRSIKPPGAPYRSGEEIRFDEAGGGCQYTQKGWCDPEDWGIWTKGYQADLRIPLAHPMNGPARLTVEAGAYISPRHPWLRVRVTVSGEAIGEWVIDTSEPVARTLPVPAAAIAGKSELLLSFHLENPVSPAECGESDDQRMLGLGLRRLRVDAEE